MLVEINERLYSEILSYCILNEINSVEDYVNGLIKKNFIIEKYGEKPLIGKQNTETKITHDETVDTVYEENNKHIVIQEEDNVCEEQEPEQPKKRKRKLTS